MRRGEVRWTQFAQPYGRRPTVLLTRNSSIDRLNAVTVAVVTTNVRDYKTHVYLDEEDGMPTECNVTAHNLQTIPKEDVKQLITTLTDQRMAEVEDAIRYALGFGEIV